MARRSTRDRRSARDPGDRSARARGEARYTADISSPRNAPCSRPSLPARVRAREEHLVEQALAAPGVRAAVGPGEANTLTDEPGHQGQPVAAIAAKTYGQARAALALVDVDWEVLEPLVDPDEAVRRGQFVGEASRLERGDVDKAIAEADVVVRADSARRPCCTARSRPTRSVCEWRGDSLDIYISTQFISGVRDEVASKLDLAPDKVRVVCEFMGGGFGSKNGAGDHTYIAAELAKRTGRPVRCMLTRREENLAAGNRNSTIERLTAAARSDGTLVALVGEFVNATGWDGWAAPTDGPMQMLYDCECLARCFIRPKSTRRR